jgi:hypothetical protein
MKIEYVQMMKQLKICMNDVIMGKIKFEENLNVQIGNPSVEIERNKNEEKEIEVVKMNLKSCMLKKFRNFMEEHLYVKGLLLCK